ncbi:MAG: hypothetical protein ACFE7R_04715, partial [Candidatus Hodarchaeota archaeon]
AYCSRYPCDWIEAHIGEITRESVSERIGEDVPDDAYEKFIEPFQGKAHLDKIRATLKASDIIEAKTVKVPVKSVVEYPKSPKIKGIRSESILHTYNLLSNLASTDFGLKHPDTVAGAGIISNRRDVLFRLLWTVVKHGTLRDSGNKLVLDGSTYTANKKGRDPLTQLSRAEIYFKMLRNLGIHAEFVQLYDDWTTAMGFLRSQIPKTHDPAWELVISFDEGIGGKSTLKAMKSYTDELSAKYQKKAYTNFSKAEMRFLSE